MAPRNAAGQAAKAQRRKEMKGCRTKAKRRKEKSLCGLAPLRAKNKMSRRRKVQACFYALIIRRGGRAPCTRDKKKNGAQRRKEMKGGLTKMRSLPAVGRVQRKNLFAAWRLCEKIKKLPRRPEY
jgi:hypothetical protein